MSAQITGARVSARRALVAVAASMAVLVPGPIGPEPAEAGNGPVLDHFQCWEANFPDFEPERVLTEDQYFLGTVKAGQPQQLCAPVEKDRQEDGVTAIVHPDYHLAYYPVTARDEIEDSDFFFNQFDCCPFVPIDGPVGLLVPTKKEGHDFPQGLDHYQCYTITDPHSIQEDGVILDDQFKRRTTTVRWSRLLCAPTNKEHGDQSFLINDSLHFLICYKTAGFEFGENNRPKVNIRNQLSRGDRNVVVKAARLLCVPSQLD